jgi:hypothetical protein
MASATFPHHPVYRYEGEPVWELSIAALKLLRRALIIRGTKQST